MKNKTCETSTRATLACWRVAFQQCPRLRIPWFGSTRRTRLEKSSSTQQGHMRGTGALHIKHADTSTGVLACKHRRRGAVLRVCVVRVREQRASVRRSVGTIVKKEHMASGWRRRVSVDWEGMEQTQTHAHGPCRPRQAGTPRHVWHTSAQIQLW